MRPWVALLALTALGQCGPAWASDSAQVLEDCASAGPPLAPTGIDGLRMACPDLERALLDLGLADQLGPDWRRQISRTAVLQLAQLVQRYRARPLSNAPHIDSLPQVMRTLQAGSAHPSWWQQFKDWLWSWLRQPQQNMGWLQRLLSQLRLPPLLARVLGYATIAAVLSLALWIVWREIKALRALARQPARAVRATRRRKTAAADSGLALPDLEALPPWQRPAALLAALVQALRRSGRLTMERALTHRELGERCAFDDPAQRTRFVGVSRLAERTLYGEEARTGSESPDPQTTQVLADGVELYRQLRA